MKHFFFFVILNNKQNEAHKLLTLSMNEWKIYLLSFYMNNLYENYANKLVNMQKNLTVLTVAEAIVDNFYSTIESSVTNKDDVSCCRFMAKKITSFIHNSYNFLDQLCQKKTFVNSRRKKN